MNSRAVIPPPLAAWSQPCPIYWRCSVGTMGGSAAVVVGVAEKGQEEPEEGEEKETEVGAVVQVVQEEEV